MQFGQIYRFAKKTLKARILSEKIPLNVMISLTNRCTAHCQYCEIPKRDKNEPDTERVFSLIDQIRKQGGQRIGFWGGEPLIRDDIVEIVRYAKSAGFFVTMDSNGHLLSRRRNALKYIDHLIVALDGDKKSHEANRGEGSHRLAMEAIDFAVGRIPLWTITVLTRHNLNSLPWLLETAESKGFLTTYQILHHNEHLSRNHRDLMPEPSEYRSFVMSLLEHHRRGAAIGSSRPYLTHLLHWPDYRQPTQKNIYRRLACFAGNLYCNVDTDGVVYPCSLLIGKVPGKNAFAQGFEAAFRACDRSGCNSCLAACFTEYNLLYSFDPATIRDWLIAMMRTKRIGKVKS